SGTWSRSGRSSVLAKLSSAATDKSPVPPCGQIWLRRVPRRWLEVTVLPLAFLLTAGGGTALGSAFLPPAGEVFQGVAGQPPGSYARATGKHPAVYQEFLAWGQWVPGITTVAANARARLMIMIGTRSGTQEM